MDTTFHLRVAFRLLGAYVTLLGGSASGVVDPPTGTVVVDPPTGTVVDVVVGPTVLCEIVKVSLLSEVFRNSNERLAALKFGVRVPNLLANVVLPACHTMSRSDWFQFRSTSTSLNGTPLMAGTDGESI